MGHVGQNYLVKAHGVKLTAQLHDVGPQIGIVSVQPGAVFIPVVRAVAGFQGDGGAEGRKQLVQAAADLGCQIDIRLQLPQPGDQAGHIHRVGGIQAVVLSHGRIGGPHQPS